MCYNFETKNLGKGEKNMRNVLIEFPTGTNLVSIGTVEDLLYYVEEYMGTEYRKCLEEDWINVIDEVKLEKECINEELKDANDELDSKNDAIRGAINHIDGLIMQKVPDEIKKVLEEIEGILFDSL